MKKNPTPVVSRSILVPYDVMLRVKEKAEKEGTSVNSVLIEAIMAFVAKDEKKE